MLSSFAITNRILEVWLMYWHLFIHNTPDSYYRNSLPYFLKWIILLQPQLITASGYPAETHQVTTEDGYVLELHRIPHGVTPATDDVGHRPVAFLHHCLLCSSSDFVMSSPDKALGKWRYHSRIFFILWILLLEYTLWSYDLMACLVPAAYMLADAGYDVWLTNARGNTYSKKHVNVSPEDESFWDFR